MTSAPSWFLQPTVYSSRVLPSIRRVDFHVPKVVMVSPGKAGVRNRVRSPPEVTQVSPNAAVIISPMKASTSIPWAMVRPYWVVSANPGSTWMALWSPAASA